MNEDNEILINFIDSVRDDMELGIEIIRLKIHLEEDISKLLEESWNEINNTFAKVRIQITDITTKELNSVGLSGSQLKLKDKVYRYSRKKVYNVKERYINKLYSKKVQIKFFLKMLKFIDIILDSLSAIIPLAHILKEFKETISNIVSD